MQRKEEDKARKLMEKEQRSMTSTPTGKALILVQRVLSVQHFIQYFVPHTLGVASKVQHWQRKVCFSLRITYSVYKRDLEFTEKIHCGRRVPLHRIIVDMDYMHQYLDEPHIKDHR